MNNRYEKRRTKQFPGGINFRFPLLVVVMLFGATPLAAAEKKTVEEWADIGLKATDQEPWDHASVLLVSNPLHKMSAEALPKVREWIGFERKLHPVVEQIRGKFEPKPTPPTAEELAAIKLDADRTLFVVYSLQAEARPLFKEWSRPQKAGLSPNWMMQVLNAGNIPHLVALMNPEEESDFLWTLLWQFPRWGTNGVAGVPFLRRVLDSALKRQSSFDIPDRAAFALAATGHDPDGFAREIADMDEDSHVLKSVALGMIGPAGWHHLLAEVLTNETLSAAFSLEKLLTAGWKKRGYESQRPRFRFEFGFFRPGFIALVEDWKPEPSTRDFIRNAPETTRLRLLAVAEDHHFTPRKGEPIGSDFLPERLVIGMLDMLKDDPSPKVAFKAEELRRKFEERAKARRSR